MDADSPQCTECGHHTQIESGHCAQCGAGVALPDAGEAGFSLMNTSLPTPISSDSYQTGGGSEKSGDDDEMLGQQLGNFVLQEKIGEGGYGVVYRAEQVFLKQPFAIKILHLSKRAAPDVIERFRREALATAQLRHANVVQLADFGMLPQERGFYLVMEMLEGQNLADALASGEAFPTARIDALIQQFCEVLHEAHELGIYHRDLKPANTFLVPHRHGHDVLKLLDFGVASMLEEKVTLTQAATILGSPAYMSPEQSQGNASTLDGRSDLYSLGVILFELLTGRMPFEADTLTGMLFQHSFEVAPDLASARPDRAWSPVLEAFVAQALAKSPDDRPQDADSFAAACSEALTAQQRLDDGDEGPQLTGPADTVASPVSEAALLYATQQGEAAQKPRGIQGLLALLVVIGIGIGGVLWWTNQTPQPPPRLAHRDSPPQPPPPHRPQATPHSPTALPQAAPPSPAQLKVMFRNLGTSLPTLLRLLHGPLDQRTKVIILHRIQNLESKRSEILPTIILLLGHKDAKIRQVAVHVIRSLRTDPEVALPLLRKPLQDSNQKVRSKAIGALLSLNKENDVLVSPMIIEFLQKYKPRAKISFLQRLQYAKHLSKSVLASIASLRKSPNRKVRKKAQKTLKTLARSNPHARAYTKPKGQSQKRHRPRKLRPRPYKPQNARHTRHGSRRKNDYKRSKKVRAPAHLQKLVDGLDSPSPKVRNSSIRGLIRAGHTATPTLLKVLRHGSTRAKAGALRTCAFRGDVRTLPTLIQILRTPEARTLLRYPLLNAMQKIPGPAAFAIERELTKGNKRHKGICTFILMRLGRAALPVYLRLLKKNDAPLQLHVVKTLGFYRRDKVKVFPHLVPMTKHSHPNIRARAAVSIGALGVKAKQGLRALVPLLRDPNPSVRYSATRALSSFRPQPPELEAPLRESLSRGPARNQLLTMRTLGHRMTITPRTRKALEGLLRSPHKNLRNQARATLNYLSSKGGGGNRYPPKPY